MKEIVDCKYLYEFQIDSNAYCDSYKVNILVIEVDNYYCLFKHYLNIDDDNNLVLVFKSDDLKIIEDKFMCEFKKLENDLKICGHKFLSFCYEDKSYKL